MVKHDVVVADDVVVKLSQEMEKYAGTLKFVDGDYTLPEELKDMALTSAAAALSYAHGEVEKGDKRTPLQILSETYGVDPNLIKLRKDGDITHESLASQLLAVSMTQNTVIDKATGKIVTTFDNRISERNEISAADGGVKDALIKQIYHDNFPEDAADVTYDVSNEQFIQKMLDWNYEGANPKVQKGALTKEERKELGAETLGDKIEAKASVILDKIAGRE